MIEQLKAAQSTGQPVCLAVSDAIGTRLPQLEQLLQRYRLARVKTVTFPEAKLVEISGGLRKGLALTAGAAMVSADQLLREENDD
jgi:hypothetical protein